MVHTLELENAIFRSTYFEVRTDEFQVAVKQCVGVVGPQKIKYNSNSISKKNCK